MNKKTVKLKESELLELIESVVGKSLDVERTKWLAEQEQKGKDVLNEKVEMLEKKIQELSKK